MALIWGWAHVGLQMILQCVAKEVEPARTWVSSCSSRDHCRWLSRPRAGWWSGLGAGVPTLQSRHLTAQALEQELESEVCIPSSPSEHASWQEHTEIYRRALRIRDDHPSSRAPAYTVRFLPEPGMQLMLRENIVQHIHDLHLREQPNAGSQLCAGWSFSTNLFYAHTEPEHRHICPEHLATCIEDRLLPELPHLAGRQALASMRNINFKSPVLVSESCSNTPLPARNHAGSREPNGGSPMQPPTSSAATRGSILHSLR